MNARNIASNLAINRGRTNNRSLLTDVEIMEKVMEYKTQEPVELTHSEIAEVMGAGGPENNPPGFTAMDGIPDNNPPG